MVPTAAPPRTRIAGLAARARNVVDSGLCTRTTAVPDWLARLEGKSSLGRLGLVTHSTAGFIDPGFTGHVTLELSNLANLPIKLWPGMKVGQLCVFRLSSPAEYPYGSAELGSRYQGQQGPTASRSGRNFHRTVVPHSHPGPPSRQPRAGT